MRIEIDRLLGSFEEAIGLLDDEQQRERLRRVIAASRSAVERSAFDLVDSVATSINGALHGAQVELAYRDGGIEVELKQAQNAEESEPWPADEGDLEKFTLRLPPWLKEQATAAAADAGRSLNAWINQTLAAELLRSGAPRSRGGRRRGPGSSLHGWIGT